MEYKILKDSEIWDRRLKKIRNLFIETEVMSLLEEGTERKCNMFLLPPHILDEYKRKYIEPNGLKVVEIARRGSSDVFTHNVGMLNGPNVTIHGVICREEEDGIAFKEALSRNDNYRMGELLGYPDCCRNLYEDVCSHNPDIIDLVVPQYTGGVKRDQSKRKLEVEGNPYCNVMLRYVGVRLAPHMPCSPSCKHSIELAKTVESAMRKLDNDSTDHVLELLSMPVTYQTVGSRVQVRNDILQINLIGYNWGGEVEISLNSCP